MEKGTRDEDEDSGLDWDIKVLCLGKVNDGAARAIAVQVWFTEQMEF